MTHEMLEYLVETISSGNKDEINKRFRFLVTRLKI